MAASGVVPVPENGLITSDPRGRLATLSRTRGTTYAGVRRNQPCLREPLMARLDRQEATWFEQPARKHYRREQILVGQEMLIPNLGDFDPSLVRNFRNHTTGNVSVVRQSPNGGHLFTFN